MLAFLYLCVCAITGMVLVAICVPDVRRLYLACAPSVKAIENIPSTLFVVSAGTVAGMLAVPFVNYYVILGLSYFVASDKLCMRIGFMVTAALFIWLVLSCLIIVNRRRIKKDEEGVSEDFVQLPAYDNKPSNTMFYSIVILLITIVSAFLMFYTYRIDRGYLLNGYSTFSDLSPHTAMISSFGKGFNFPTEYMHFSGDGIKYHFLFYFLAGMLEYLGFPIDYALNIPSIISMVCAMILLGLLASLLSGRRLAFAISPILVFLRSSLNVFIHIGDLMAQGNSLPGAISTVLSEASWYGVTPFDEWGVWAVNVYPNQRHLMLGIAVILVCIILFIPFVRRLCISAMSSGSFSGFFKAILFSRNAWLPRNDDPLSSGTIALFSCILVVAMPYFHGSCLISLLLVLFGMALVSESRLLHLMVAVSAVCSSFIQTLALSGGASNIIKMSFTPGFLLSEKSDPVTGQVLLDWGQYLITVTGATLVVALVCTVVLLFHDIIKKKPVYRFFLMLAFLNPLIFAFTFQVSLEMLANHKFIQVTLILADAFVAIFMANLLVVPGRRKIAVAAAADIEADEEDNTDEDLSGEEEVTDAEALEATVSKTDSKDEEKEELPPVTSEEEKTEPEEVKFGDDEEKPFEVLSDADDSEDGLPEEIIDDSDDADVAFVSESTAEAAEDKAEDKKEDKEEEEDKDITPDRSLEKFPTETSVSMRPGNLIKKEDDENASETEAEEKTETEEKESDEPAEEIKSEDSTGSDSKNEESKADESEDSEAPEELPFEVLDDEDNEADSDEKALDTVKEDSDDKEDSEIAEKESDEDEDDEDDEDDDDSDMVLEHNEIAQSKAKGLPGPVWVIFEIFGVIAASILFIALVGTGISEWATYININSTPMAVKTNSPVTEWIEQNTAPNDVFLTPEWSMNRFLLAGRPMYYGWPYYAWSAGHDTDTRDKIYVWLISGCGGDINEFRRYCKERGIRYLIADPEFEDGEYGEGVFFNRDFFERNLTQVAYFTEENTVIYKIY